LSFNSKIKLFMILLVIISGLIYFMFSQKIFELIYEAKTKETKINQKNYIQTLLGDIEKKFLNFIKTKEKFYLKAMNLLLNDEVFQDMLITRNRASVISELIRYKNIIGFDKLNILSQTGKSRFIAGDNITYKKGFYLEKDNLKFNLKKELKISSHKFTLCAVINLNKEFLTEFETITGIFPVLLSKNFDVKFKCKTLKLISFSDRAVKSIKKFLKSSKDFLILNIGSQQYLSCIFSFKSGYLLFLKERPEDFDFDKSYYKSQLFYGLLITILIVFVFCFILAGLLTKSLNAEVLKLSSQAKEFTQLSLDEDISTEDALSALKAKIENKTSQIGNLIEDSNKRIEVFEICLNSLKNFEDSLVCSLNSIGEIKNEEAVGSIKHVAENLNNIYTVGSEIIENFKNTANKLCEIHKLIKKNFEQIDKFINNVKFAMLPDDFKKYFKIRDILVEIYNSLKTTSDFFNEFSHLSQKLDFFNKQINKEFQDLINLLESLAGDSTAISRSLEKISMPDRIKKDTAMIIELIERAKTGTNKISSWVEQFLSEVEISEKYLNNSEAMLLRISSRLKEFKLKFSSFSKIIERLDLLALNSALLSTKTGDIRKDIAFTASELREVVESSSEFFKDMDKLFSSFETEIEFAQTRLDDIKTGHTNASAQMFKTLPGLKRTGEVVEEFELRFNAINKDFIESITSIMNLKNLLLAILSKANQSNFIISSLKSSSLMVPQIERFTENIENVSAKFLKASDEIINVSENIEEFYNELEGHVETLNSFLSNFKEFKEKIEQIHIEVERMSVSEDSFDYINKTSKLLDKNYSNLKSHFSALAKYIETDYIKLEENSKNLNFVLKDYRENMDKISDSISNIKQNLAIILQILGRN